MLKLKPVDLSSLLESDKLHAWNIPILTRRLNDHRDTIGDHDCLNWHYCLQERCGLAKYCSRFKFKMKGNC